MIDATLNKHVPITKNNDEIEAVASVSKQTWNNSITTANRTFAASVKKLTLMGLNRNFPSTLDI